MKSSSKKSPKTPPRYSYYRVRFDFISILGQADALTTCDHHVALQVSTFQYTILGGNDFLGNLKISGILS